MTLKSRLLNKSIDDKVRLPYFTCTQIRVIYFRSGLCSVGNTESDASINDAFGPFSNFQSKQAPITTPIPQPVMSVERPVTWSDSDMQATVTKLLDKAGSDPRLTPRILREKAEQRMNLLKGDLKPNRERIKDIIYEWWRVRKSAEEDRENGILKSVCSLNFSLTFFLRQLLQRSIHFVG